VRAGLTLVAGFATLIAIGTLLLLLPAATAQGTSAPLSVALFTATSAVCVTGLTVVETGTYWSRLGQVIILGLLEVGGVGFGAGASFLFWLIGRNISLTDRLALREIVPGSTVAQVVRSSLVIVAISLVIQAGGALVLFAAWLLKYSVGDAAYLALFHTVSAFCNGGFDVLGTVGHPGTSLAPERGNPLVILPIGLLVLIGGLGFPVITELVAWRPLRRLRRLGWRDRHTRARVPPPLSLNTRLVLVAHLGLFGVGAVLIGLLEATNPHSLGGEGWNQRTLDIFTAAVNPRSGGFVTEPLTAFRPTTILVLLLLMFIGAASAGTGGGVKVNTIAILFASVGATLAGRPRPELFKRTLTQESINKALVVVVLSALVIATATFMLSLTEPGIALEHLLFEVVSAFSTVGLSLDVTPQLSEAGRLIVELMMFAGRLGPLSLVLVLAAREQALRVVYAEEPVLVG
jgi:trk system potassium uptake protein TrkH